MVFDLDKLVIIINPLLKAVLRNRIASLSPSKNSKENLDYYCFVTSL